MQSAEREMSYEVCILVETLWIYTGLRTQIYMIYLIAIGLTLIGSSTVHIYTQTIHRTTQSTQTIHRTTHFTNQVECGPCPVFVRYTLAFALQLRKKHGKPSVRVAGECQLAKSIQSRPVQERLERTGNLYTINMHPTEENFKSSSVSGRVRHFRSGILCLVC